MGRIKKSFRDERIARRDAELNKGKHTPETIGAHPSRYPKHDCCEKGQVLGGTCNITRCDNGGAVWWNKATMGLYCTPCARQINWHPDEEDLCFVVDEKPAVEEMGAIRGW